MKRGFPQKIQPLYPLCTDSGVSKDFHGAHRYYSPKQSPLGYVFSAAYDAENTADAIFPLARDRQDWDPQLSTALRNRRVRTSAAMVGLAISMGVSDLLTLSMTESALAADDPIATKPVSQANFDNLDFHEHRSQVWIQEEVEPMAASFSADSPRSSSSVLMDSELGLAPQDFFNHIVLPGETLAGISQRYAIDVAVLRIVNQLGVDEYLSPGETLWIPKPGQVQFVPQDFGSVPLVESHQAQNLDALEGVALGKQLDGKEQHLASIQPREVQSVLPANLAGFDSIHSDEVVREVPVVEFQLQEIATSSPVTEDVSPLSNGSEPAPGTIAVSATLEEHNSVQSLQLSDLMPYKVRAGDTLDTIARDYAVSRSDLIAVNNIQNPNVLEINQLIGIPRSTSHLDPSEAMPLEEERPADLAPADLAPATLTPPASDLPSLQLQQALPTSSSTYRVQPGDTLIQIARKHDISLDALAKANQIRDPNLIYSHQLLQVPVQSQSPVSIPNDNAASDNGLLALSISSPLLVEPVLESPHIESQDVVLSPESVVNTETETSLSNHSVRGSVAEIEQDLLQPNANHPEKLAAVSFSNELPDSSVTLLRDDTLPQPQSKNPYIEELLAEVKVLQERYRSQGTNLVDVSESNVDTSTSLESQLPEQSDQVLVTTARSERINPEFNPSSYTEGFQDDIQQLRDSRSTQAEWQASSEALIDTPVVEADQPQVIAVAPLGSENYEPLVQSLLGQTVSPDLPPLTADPYLPDGTVAQGYIWPAKGVLTSGFGWRWGRMHKGIDIAGPVGTPIVAAASGVVVSSGWNSGGYGNLVEIEHPDGSVTLYAHNNRLLVNEGQWVQQGQQIAEMGSTGFSTGPHLHFEIHPSGQGAVNPMAYLPR